MHSFHKSKDDTSPLLDKNQRLQQKKKSPCNNDENLLSKAAIRMRKYRENIKNKSEKYKSYCTKEKERSKMRRQTEKDQTAKDHEREQARLRARKYRQKLKDLGQRPEQHKAKTQSTRAGKDKMRAYWREKKKESRERQTSQKKRRVKEYDRARKKIQVPQVESIKKITVFSAGDKQQESEEQDPEIESSTKANTSNGSDGGETQHKIDSRFIAHQVFLPNAAPVVKIEPSDATDEQLERVIAHQVLPNAAPVVKVEPLDATDTDGNQNLKCKDAINQKRLCRVCQFKGTTVDAVNICHECDGLLLCQDCSNLHHTYSSTSSHILNKEVSICPTHGERLIRFCETCVEPVCSLCIVINHVGHSVKKVDEVITNTLKEASDTIATAKCRIADLEEIGGKVNLTKATYCETRDKVFHSIDCTVDACIENLENQRKDMKEKFQTEFSYVDCTEAQSLQIKTTVDHISTAVKKCEETISSVMACPEYMETLNNPLLSASTITEQNVLKDIKVFCNDITNAVESNTVSQIVHLELPSMPIICFKPAEEMKMNIGELEIVTPPMRQSSPYNSLEQIGEPHTLRIGNARGMIQNIAILGIGLHAISITYNHSEHSKSDEIVIIEHDNTNNRIKRQDWLKKTNYGIAAFHSVMGKPDLAYLAVLCHLDGETSLKIYDVSGIPTQVKAIHSIPVPVVDLPNGNNIKSIDFSTNRFGCCVFLQRIHESKLRITVQKFNGEFSTNQEFTIKEQNDKTVNNKIACGGKYLFCVGVFYKNGSPLVHISKYEMDVEKKKIVWRDTCVIQAKLSGRHVLDISATITDDAYIMFQNAQGQAVIYRVAWRGTLWANPLLEVEHVGQKKIPFCYPQFDVWQNTVVICQQARNSFAHFRLNTGI